MTLIIPYLTLKILRSGLCFSQWDEYSYMTIQKYHAIHLRLGRDGHSERQACLESFKAIRSKNSLLGLEQTLTRPRSTPWTLLVIPGSSSPAYMDSSQQRISWTWWTNICQSQSWRRRWDWVISWNPFQACIFWLPSHSKQKYKWSSQATAGLMGNFCSLQLHHSYWLNFLPSLALSSRQPFGSDFSTWIWSTSKCLGYK